MKGNGPSMIKEIMQDLPEIGLILGDINRGDMRALSSSEMQWASYTNKSLREIRKLVAKILGAAKQLSQ